MRKRKQYFSKNALNVNAFTEAIFAIKAGPLYWFLCYRIMSRRFRMGPKYGEWVLLIQLDLHMGITIKYRPQICGTKHWAEQMEIMELSDQ